MRMRMGPGTAHRTARAVQCWAATVRAPFNAKKSFSSVSSLPQNLNWEELYFSSRLARLSGYCYYPQEELKELVQAEGLELIATGRTPYTSWYVADGCMDHSAFYNAACKQLPWPVARAASAIRQAAQQQQAVPSHTHDNGLGHNHQQLQPQPQPPAAQGQAQDGTSDSAAATDPRVLGGRRMRFVCVRGVQWGAPDADISAISTALMNFWPAPLLPATPSTAPQAPLVSHAGVTLLASDLFRQLAPYLTLESKPQGTTTTPTASSTAPSNNNSQQPPQQAQQGEHAQHGQAPAQLCIAGHSLGGALGMLVLAQCVMSGLRHPSTTSCSMYGSPPVLAHRDGGGGHRVLQVLGLSDTSVRSFVLENDPVPRALLTADPAFRTLKQYGPVKQLLDARTWWSAGPGSLLSELLGQNPDAQQASSPPPKSAWDIGAMMQQLQQTIQKQRVVVPMMSSDRFVFENVGSVYLMRGGSELVPVGSASEVEDLLRMAVNDFLSQPARAIQASVQAWLDHHHKSYSHDLETAALAQLKRQLRRTHLQHQQHPHGHANKHMQAQIMHQHQPLGPVQMQHAPQHVRAPAKHAHPSDQNNGKSDHRAVRSEQKSDHGRSHRKSNESKM